MPNKSGWERHGITHMSASSLNMFAGSQGAWVAKYLFGRKFPFSVAARAGVLAEEAIVSVLLGKKDDETAIKDAETSYNKAIMLDRSDNNVKRGEAIRGFVENGLRELLPFGAPEFDGDNQKSFSIMCKGDGWELPVIGYLDCFYPQHKLIVDIKTTMKAPSVMSSEHMRQCALYHKAFNTETRFLYLTPKKAVWHSCEDVEGVMAEIKALLNRQEKLLRSFDKEDLVKIVDVQPASFYWGGAEGIRKELFLI